jgi:hypothetical protein
MAQKHSFRMIITSDVGPGQHWFEKLAEAKHRKGFLFFDCRYGHANDFFAKFVRLYDCHMAVLAAAATTSTAAVATTAVATTAVAAAAVATTAAATTTATATVATAAVPTATTGYTCLHHSCGVAYAI